MSHEYFRITTFSTSHYSLLLPPSIVGLNLSKFDVRNVNAADFILNTAHQKEDFIEK